MSARAGAAARWVRVNRTASGFAYARLAETGQPAHPAADAAAANGNT
jgi:hypothetical protein